MSLQYGIQSVIFYVLSCSTCTKINHRRKAKKTAERERAEKHALEMEQPGLYRHPSPFNTNPFWDEEIMLGPGPPKRKGDKGGSKNASTRALNTAGAGSSTMSEGGMSTDAPSSSTIVAEDSRLSGDGWNRTRYQREDEELWGHDPHKPGQRIREALATAGSSVGSTFRALEGRLSKSGPPREEEASPYYVARNPPVNDLHPPVVSSQPRHKGATRWMLQPPPPAKVMEGKERAHRSRSGSRASSRKGPDGASLSRQVTGRAIEEKIRRGETPTELELRSLHRPDTNSKTSLRTPRSGQLERGRSHSMESYSGSDEPSRRKKGSPMFSPTVTNRRMSQDSIDDSPLLPEGPTSRSKPDGLARPALVTIVSSSAPVPQLKSAEQNTAPLKEIDVNKDLLSQKVTSHLLPTNTNVIPSKIPVLLPSADLKSASTTPFTFTIKQSQENIKIGEGNRPHSGMVEV